MQPPPRKVKVTQELKNTHAEQMAKLSMKHQTECDLLEDLRTYSQKKSAIERDYAQALQKLASHYLKREWPGMAVEEQGHSQNVYAVWRSYLESTVQLAQVRMNNCENYKNKISDPAKSSRLCKEQQLKKYIDQLSCVQVELQDTVKELTKSRKKYSEAEQVAQAVREKVELEAKSKLSLFQSRISLQKASVKLKAKRSDCNAKATHARNEYLLTLAAANAHHDRYYDTDLISCIKVLDGSVYDHFKDYLTTFCRAELEMFQAIRSTFQAVLEKSSRVTQEFNQQVFLQENPVFCNPPAFQFQPCESDTGRQLQTETGSAAEHSLNKEARKWATRAAREHKSIIHGRRALEECETQGLRPSERDPGDMEQRVEEARRTIRRAETVKVKAEARLNLLRDAGVSVDTWLKSAMNQVMEELENERWASLPTLTTHDPSQPTVCDDEREDGEDLEESMETCDDSSSSPSGTLGRNYPLTCRVVYSYKACQADELTIEEQEVLDVIEDGDMEDWVKARNQAGQVGYVPEKYLQFPTSSSLLNMLQTLAALDARSHSSSNSTEPELASGSMNGDANLSFVKALYDYEGQTNDELSFPEGAIIHVLNKDNHEDDGFWEGEFNGRVGVFPSVLVEDLAESENGEEKSGSEAEVSPSQCPPCLLPPPPLSAQSPCSPDRSPHPPLQRSATVSLPASPVNGENRTPPTAGKGPALRHSSSFSRPPRSISDGSLGKLRPVSAPVRAAPPPPKQQARRRVEKTEEVEITLV
ncbi:F-BAR and double SH3 domains protein 2 isoform X1 [Conger conger]|uniref:F-BAR and double SH3 domains protein 2 isoform X1 n=2 Tax=Conger conger TaxID=82655 RepID=UPI002A5A97B5|nr:F-BAR and double SH3 domains protein 2 isoform X1 [Conger conger]